MREKYESLALADLKAIARSRGIKGTSAMKKAEVVEAMLELDSRESRTHRAEGRRSGRRVISRSSPKRQNVQRSRSVRSVQRNRSVRTGRSALRGQSGVNGSVRITRSPWRIWTAARLPTGFWK